MHLYDGFKYLAFKSDPEKIHDFMIKAFKSFPRSANFLPQIFLPHIQHNSRLSLSDGHMQWKFPVGMAAGFDKNAQAFPFLSNLGFGAVEVGTVTPIAQKGNPRPRIFRVTEVNGLRNSMGFPNQGSDIILKNIQLAQAHCQTHDKASSEKLRPILGINLGKNKLTAPEETGREYAYLYQKFAPFVDYLVINISSPNTPGLRSFQDPTAFTNICNQLNAVRNDAARNDHDNGELKKPLYLKISPDLEKKDVFDLVDIAKKNNFAGIIATNTTTQHQLGIGGLSGDYLKGVSRQIRNWCCEAAREKKDFSVVGVGGISTFEEILDFWKRGGSFVQIYTAFIYQGPNILLKFQQDMLNYLDQTGARSLQEIMRELRST